MTAKNFYITDKFGNMSDPQKSNLWEVEIYNPKCIKDHRLWSSCNSNTIGMKDKLKFRATGVTIPDRKVAYTSSKYLGHTYNFPLPADDGSKSIDIDFLEREDQTVITMLNSWIHEIYDHSQLSNYYYKRYPDFKKSFCTTIIIRQYGMNGELLPAEVSIRNAFLSNISSVKLDYGKSDAIKYTATFVFDYWSLDGTENCKDALKGD